MLWDTHTHTHFSGDSQADPLEMIRAAQAAGLAGICFTDHLDLDYQKDPSLFLLDLPAYFHEMLPLATDWQNALQTTGHSHPPQTSASGQTDFTVCIGIELGLQPHLAQTHRQILSAYPFDFVIGSSHVADGVDPYYAEYYQGRTEREAYEAYFSSILKNILAFDEFDVYGHLDYVVRYGPNRNRDYSYDMFREILEQILKALIERGKGMEVNSGGLRCGLGHPNPTVEILRRYRELGGEIVTIGSDAHTPEDIAFGFLQVAELLRQAGFRYFTVFRQRQKEFLPL